MKNFAVFGQTITQKNYGKLNRKLPVSFMLLALLPNPAHALDLLQAWQAAASHDKSYAVAKAAQGVAVPKQKQADALWRPNVVLSDTLGGAYQSSRMDGAAFSAPGFGSMNGVTFQNSINAGIANRFAIQANQPLYDPKRRAEQAQLKQSAEMDELQWQAAQQRLMLTLAQHYFDVALAQYNLQVWQQQSHSVEHIAKEMQDRFTIGSTPITDSHEAKARLALVQAQLLNAELDLENKQTVLADMTGMVPTALTPQLPQSTLAESPSLQAWLQQAYSQAFAVRQSTLAQHIAEKEAQKYSFDSSIKVDAIAQAALDYAHGNGDFGTATNRQNNALIGVQVSVPLSTGGYRNAKLEEAQQLITKAQAETELARQQTEQQIKQSYNSLQTGKARLQALQQAISASELRLDATKLGRQVGDRTTLDVLLAENDLANAQLALRQAQVQQIMQRLTLAYLVGQLNETLLAGIK